MPLVGHRIAIDSNGGLAPVDFPRGWLAVGQHATLPVYVAFWLSFVARQVQAWRRRMEIGVGILKYRLYDIDRIISRTLAYVVVTGLLVAVYAGLVLVATQVLTVKSPMAVAASTLAAAALFNPLRRRVQRAGDRRATGHAMTLTRQSPNSRHGSKTPWIWTRSGTTWPLWWITPWNPPAYRCGSASIAETGWLRGVGRCRQLRYAACLPGC